MKISAIVAMAKNRVIGKNNQLPWRIPKDLAYFKKITLHHPILMGRKTFESIGRILPNRPHVIISRNTNLSIEGAHVAQSIEDALGFCQTQFTPPPKEVFIIGGAEIYRQSLPWVQRIYLTWVDQEISGDAFFPELSCTLFHPELKDPEFEMISEETHLLENPPFRFILLEKKKKT
ncbi:MAG: dihydrofolate reductase [Bdellovibrionia bacterium]